MYSGVSYYHGEDENINDKTLIPIVKFVNKQEKIIHFYKWSIENADGKILATRYQVFF